MKYVTYNCPIIFRPNQFGYIAKTSVLPDLIFEGESYKEIIEQVRQVLICLAEALITVGLPLPPGVEEVQYSL